MKAKATTARLLVAGGIAIASAGAGAIASDTVVKTTDAVVTSTADSVATKGAGRVAAAARDDALDARVAQLAEQLRCPVCQNQTLADSQAPLAVDLRQRIREQLATGASEPAVIGYMTERYGDFVRYRPAVGGRTWLLWFGPFVLLLAGLGGLFVRVRKQGESDVSLACDLSTADQRRLDLLLRGSVAGERP